jgi:(p)ppGpp synthase/HD superfamily hydrolase
MNLAGQTIEHWIKRSVEIAYAAHEGQKRIDGSPYIKHPFRVADAVEDRLKPIAYLHDVVEDTKVTLDDLKKEGFPSYIINAVDLLTHRKEDTNMEYWKKILTNPDAVAVKVADLKDNLSDQPNEYQKQKYARALKLFRDAGATV